jgi:outer membrane protein TolC
MAFLNQCTPCGIVIAIDLGGGSRMKSKYFRGLFGTAIMAFTLMVGLGITAQAQTPWDSYQYRRQQEELRRQEELQRQQEQQYQIYQQNDRWRYGRGRGSDGYPYLGGSFDFRQTALNAGYGAGNKEGRRDRGHGGYYRTDFWRFSSYRDATKDYNSKRGDRELYRRYFRLAFENGYADGLRGY